MDNGSGRDVKRMYEAYPYPAPTAGGVIRDLGNMVALLFPPRLLAGKRILDAGCGTGHRLIGLAQRWPQASFTGIDFSAASLRTASALADQHGVGNVTFLQADLLALDLAERFDLIVSTGVIHHLENPERGLGNLARHLAPGGHLVLWLYHALGEFDRLLARELVLTLWDRESMSFDAGLETMRALDVSLARDRYSGAFARRDNQVLDDASINVDGFLHPIVNAYRFDQAFAMLARCGMHWAAIHNISLGHNGKLIDPAQASASSQRMFCLAERDLFAASSMQARYRRLPIRDKLKAIELVMKPNGFTVVAGKDDSHLALDARMQGGLVSLLQLAAVDQLRQP